MTDSAGMKRHARPSAIVTDSLGFVSPNAPAGKGAAFRG